MQKCHCINHQSSWWNLYYMMTNDWLIYISCWSCLQCYRNCKSRGIAALHESTIPCKYHDNVIPNIWSWIFFWFIYKYISFRSCLWSCRIQRYPWKCIFQSTCWTLWAFFITLNILCDWEEFYDQCRLEKVSLAQLYIIISCRMCFLDHIFV